jgi:hypothetical protein
VPAITDFHIRLPICQTALDGRLIDKPRDFAVVQDLPMYSVEFGLLQLFLKVVFLAPRSEVDPVLKQVRRPPRFVTPCAGNRY